MLEVIKSFLKIIFLDKASLRFAVGIIIGFAFSISVILATVGVMDGFEWSLKLGLKKSMGDINIYSHKGHFKFESEVKPLLENMPESKFTSVLKTEGFLVSNDISKGIIVKGVDQESFSKLSGLKVNISEGEVALGIELAKFLDLKIDDEVVLALSSGNTELNDLPGLEVFKVGQIVEHGIYQKDMRFVYMRKEGLQEILNLPNLSNEIIMETLNENKVNYMTHSDLYIQDIEFATDKVEEALGDDFYARPFWEEFDFLLRAVSTEKYMIGMILQLVVVISIFNVLAFVIFINERRSRELFLFQALGMSQKKIYLNMMVLVIISWMLACVVSIGFVQFFNFSLQNLPVFQLPGDIYTLGAININLEISDYLIVFGIAFFWVYLMAYFGLSRLRKKSILQGLRREFA